MMIKEIFTLSLLLSYSFLYCQTTTAPAVDNQLLAKAECKNVGPSVFGGRVVDLAVNPDAPHEFYVAYASGGLWHTINNGTTFTPLFDHEDVMTIGDIDVHWPTRKIVIGTGEVNSSRSSYAGKGIYTSDDNGTQWQNLGLPESHHIGRVIINKEDPSIMTVAVLGHLYTPNEERGIYQTTDGGKTWSHTLYVNENAGAVDLIQHPIEKNVMYAATWERTRRAWNFTESGSGSGIYKSEDGGKSWQLITKENAGFPTGDGVGRIGIDLAVKEGTTYLYAILDNYNRRPAEDGKEEEGLTKDDFQNMDKATFLKLSDEDLDGYLEKEGMNKYDAKMVKKLVADDAIKPIALKEYVEDANRLLFDTPVVGAEVYVTTDEGASWTKTHDTYIDHLYNSYGYYFGQIRVNPTDKDQLYIMGVPILRSDDGGQSWKNVNGDNVHADHHALWINPANTEHIINGNDGGVNISYDAGDNWIKCTSPAVGQFYYVNVDSKKANYTIYGGTQDNGVWKGASSYDRGVRWQMSGSYPYETIMGGDGMQVQIDNRDNTTVYTGFQFGNYFRINTATGDRTYITPKHKLGDRPYRWNWQSPILLSEHNQDIVYFGANKLLRSMDKGETFTEISHDLTHGGKKGDVAYGTLTTISESSETFGLIYTGSDDGKVYRTDNGGHTWTDISAGLPEGYWVSRVVASQHDADRVYVSLNAYRNDIFEAYVYTSDDKGATWTTISKGLPAEPVNVIKEDADNEDLLYVGTDHGTYISADGGNSYLKLGGIPNVPVHDLVVHKSTDELIIGTHGRSIYKIGLQTFKKGISSSSQLVMNGSENIRHSDRWGSSRNSYTETYTPDYSVEVYSKVEGNATLTILADNKIIRSQSVALTKGLQSIALPLIVDNTKALEKVLNKDKKKKIRLKPGDDGIQYLPKGEYTVRLQAANHKAEQNLIIK